MFRTLWDVPLVQIILLSAVSLAVLLASATYLYHLYRWSPYLESASADDSIIPPPSSELDRVFDALAATPCAVCCAPVGEEPMQRNDGRWCCVTCVGTPSLDDDDSFFFAHSVLLRFQHGLVPASESEAQANIIRSALRTSIDAHARNRELLAVIAAYQLIAHRLEQSSDVPERVRKAIDTAREIERLMKVGDDETAMAGAAQAENVQTWH
jgi:hypothetical protein